MDWVKSKKKLFLTLMVLMIAVVGILFFGINAHASSLNEFDSMLSNENCISENSENLNLWITLTRKN